MSRRYKYYLSLIVKNDLNKVYICLVANKLMLIWKNWVSPYIWLKKRPSNVSKKPSIVIDDAPIKQVLVFKSLGLKNNQNLNWGDHIQMTSKKVASDISAIKRVKDGLKRVIYVKLKYE